MSRSKSLKPSEGWLEPTRIRLARHRVGLTKATVAQHLGVTVRTVTNYETEGAPAPAGPALATALDCQLEFLMRPPVDALEADRVFFRARRRASAAQRHAAVAAGRIGIELYEWIAARFGLPELDVPELDHLDPHTAALTLRAMWGWELVRCPTWCSWPNPGVFGCCHCPRVLRRSTRSACGPSTHPMRSSPPTRPRTVPIRPGPRDRPPGAALTTRCWR